MVQRRSTAHHYKPSAAVANVPFPHSWAVFNYHHFVHSGRAYRPSSSMSLRSIKRARLHPVNVNRSRRPRQRIGSSRVPLELREQGCARPQRPVRVCAEYHSDHGTEANRRSLLKSAPYGTLRLVLGSPTTSPFRSRPGISVFRLGGDCSGFGIPA